MDLHGTALEVRWGLMDGQAGRAIINGTRYIQVK